MKRRVLIVAHGHPDKCKGGAEIAAYHEFQELRARGVDATFLARDAGPSHGGSAFSAHRGDRELLFHTAVEDHFNFRTARASHVFRDFRGLLKRLQPDVVHFHHFTHMGLEMLRETRNSCPKARIALTLHEYLAICHHNGQMVRPETLELCSEASPSRCAQCFPQRSAADFFLRENYIKALLADIDVFFAPSTFLAKRYIQWGLPGERIVVLENGHPRQAGEPLPSLPATEIQTRFAFFGQINRYKGLEVLLDAVDLLKERGCSGFRLSVHGANLAGQSTQYQEMIATKFAKLEGMVTNRGPYNHEQLPGLMQQCGWVVVPSIWWENSPMVIQEAFLHGKPVICSDIGGMAEKVVHGVNGLHFRVRDSAALARTLEQACGDLALRSRLVEGIVVAPTVAQWVDRQFQAIE